MPHVVIGGGILGVSAAYSLIKNGQDVVLIDENHSGKATSAGAGIICPWISSVQDPDWYELAKRGALYYPELIDSLAYDGEQETGYGKTGAIAVSKDKNELNRIEEVARKKKQETEFVGEIKRLNSEQAKDLFPPLNKNLSAVYVSGGARVDGRLLTNAMRSAFEKLGGQVMEGKARLIAQNGQIAAVETQDDRIEAESVIVAAGAWSNELLSPLGLSLSLDVQRGQIVHLKVDEDTSKWPVVLPQTSHYMVAFNDSRIAFGATRETGSGFAYRMTAGGIQEVLNEGLDVAPGLHDATLGEVRIGFRPMSSDKKPLLGKSKKYENLVIATGLGASGLTIGPYAGKVAGQLAVNEKVDIELEAYNPFR
ncbi:NAD(P)/FAD-dependent oxidoreductase [Tenuibacillus multivorans]|uniref:D-amino-acid dehydrogenase n=1 Tax=Tenuibacillus multivorans TaxID=237069 RepID=A0A1G9YLA1_9BACI|nr:FAD-dependent oxidoreductase [Tenuibacillus multivorans]GEL78460.1 oxidoreductase [Tenuibacillus multivorans]SDN09928.1 D-amino-acid dehydrogenase [Tenuibacillus multivorans]